MCAFTCKHCIGWCVLIFMCYTGRCVLICMLHLYLCEDVVVCYFLWCLSGKCNVYVCYTRRCRLDLCMFAGSSARLISKGATTLIVADWQWLLQFVCHVWKQEYDSLPASNKWNGEYLIKFTGVFYFGYDAFQRDFLSLWVWTHFTWNENIWVKKNLTFALKILNQAKERCGSDILCLDVFNHFGNKASSK